MLLTASSKRIISIVFLLLITTRVNGQIKNEISGRPADYPEIFKRTLAVEIREEDPEIIKDLGKKEKDHAKLEEYKLIIQSYNENIKKAVDGYWKLNENIVYKTTTEINQIQKSKDPQFVCLYYTESKDQKQQLKGSYIMERSSVVVPTINYSRSEKSLLSQNFPDYKAYLPLASLKETDIRLFANAAGRTDLKKRKNDFYSEGELIFTIQSMQKNIEYTISSGKITKYEIFVEIEAEKNCSKTSSKILLIDTTLLFKRAEILKIKEKYSYQCEFTGAEEISAAIKNGDAKYAYIISVPYGITKSTGPTMSVASLASLRLVVDAANGDILGCQGVPKFGAQMGTEFRESDFKAFSTCK